VSNDSIVMPMFDSYLT